MKYIKPFHKNKRYNFKQLRLIPILMIICMSCTSSPRDTLLVGRFVDSEVSGLRYICGSRTGLTNSDGKFYFKTGEIIQFFIGDVALIAGDPAEAEALMTPIELVAGAIFVENESVLNIARFILTLDIDGDPENGIEITSDTHTHARGITITFEHSTDDFEANNPDLQALLDTLYSEGVFEEERTLVSADYAQSHLFKSLAKNNASDIVLINMGDNFTNGTQAGTGNVHEHTQEHSFAYLLSHYMGTGCSLTWANPLILKSKENDVATKTRKDATILPYNLGVDGATTETLLNEKTTTSGNNLLDELMKPIQESTEKGEDVSQLEAAIYLANKKDNEDKRIIITLWVGNNDILGAAAADTWSKLTEEDINDYLSEEHINTVKTNLETIISRLNNEISRDAVHIFIANIPYVNSFGTLFNKTDLEFLASYENPENSITAIENTEYIGFGPFLSLNSPANIDLSHPTQDCIAKELNVDSSSLNARITQTVAVDSNILDSDEVILINNVIDDINNKIEALASDNTNVTLVELNSEDDENTTALFNKLRSGDGIPVSNRQDDWFDDLGPSAEDPDTITRTYGKGFYSLDGYHPSYTGYALITDEFIKVINEENIGVRIKPVDIEYLWESDPYRDFDGDGFSYNPGSTSSGEPIIDENLGRLTDCNDSNPDILPAYITDTEECN